MKNKLLKAGAVTILTPVMVTNIAMADEVNSSSNHNDVQTRIVNKEMNQLGIINVKSGTNLNIRKSSGTNSKIIGKIPSGKTVTLLGSTDNGWYKVRYNNIEGYSSSEYIKIIGLNEDNSESSISSNGKVVNVKTALNIRSKATTSSSVIGKLTNGQIVKVIGKTNNGWYKVESNNLTGYVCGDYIKLTQENVSAEVVNVSKVGKIATVTASALNVRNGAGTSYSVINKLYKNDVVKIIDSNSNGWMKVQLKSSVTGWVDGNYLTNFRNGSLNESTNSNSNANSNVISNKVEAVLNTAKSKLGCPYAWGAEGPNSFDCSGLVYYVFKNATGITLPRTSSSQATAGYAVSKSNLKPGDLVFFNTNGKGISHVGIYIGNGEMIHSPRTGDVVKRTNINSAYYTSKFVTARRIVE